MKPFQQTQLAFAAHLRDPQHNPPPEAIEDRRVGIYRDLIFNNIESFIVGAFPVLRSIMSDACWQALVREFIASYKAQSPYFLQISQEFLAFLLNQRGLRATDPAFLIELAHYEWVELALDVADAQALAEVPLAASLVDAEAWNPVRLQLSPVAMNLAYRFPVHKISPGYQPTLADVSPEQTTYLLVYRNRTDQVKFIETNALTHRLLYLLQAAPQASLGDQLAQIAAELHHPNPAQLLQQAVPLLRQFHALGLVALT